MNEEGSLGFSGELIQSNERMLLNQIKEGGPLDPHREVSRIINIINDILNLETDLDHSSQEMVYSRLKRFMNIQYHKTHQYDLDRDERYVWYLSTITCLKQFQSQLKPHHMTDPDQVIEEFQTVIDGYYRQYLSTFSERNDITDLGDKLNPKYLDIEGMISTQPQGNKEVNFVNHSKKRGYVEQTSKKNIGSKDLLVT